MPGLPTPRLLILLLLGLILSGCGFRLAGATSLPPELNQINLLTSGFNKHQRNRLRRQLVLAGAEVSGQQAATAAQLRVSLKQLPDRRLVTSASNGKIIERLSRSLNFSIKNADGKQLAESRTLTQQKDIALDDDNLLSSGVERRSVVQDLEQALFNQLIRQLKRI